MSLNQFEFAEAYASLKVRDAQFNQGLGAAEQRLDRLKMKMEVVANVAKVMLVAGAGGVAFFVKKAADAQEAASKFGTTFRFVMDDANAAVKELDESFGLTANSAMKLLGNTGDLLAGFGFAQKESLKLSTEVQKLAVDLASFSNVEGGTEAASQALTKALLGEREEMKKLGVVILDSDVKREVAIMRTEGLTFATERQAKAHATLRIAMQQSQNAIGDYARTQESFANQWREFLGDLEEVAIELGQTFLPMATDLLEWVRRILPAFREWIDENKEMIPVWAKQATMIAGFLIAFPKLIGLIQGLTKAYRALAVAQLAARASGLTGVGAGVGRAASIGRGAMMSRGAARGLGVVGAGVAAKTALPMLGAKSVGGVAASGAAGTAAVTGLVALAAVLPGIYAAYKASGSAIEAETNARRRLEGELKAGKELRSKRLADVEQTFADNITSYKQFATDAAAGAGDGELEKAEKARGMLIGRRTEFTRRLETEKNEVVRKGLQQALVVVKNGVVEIDRAIAAAQWTKKQEREKAQAEAAAGLEQAALESTAMAAQAARLRSYKAGSATTDFSYSEVDSAGLQGAMQQIVSKGDQERIQREANVKLDGVNRRLDELKGVLRENNFAWN